MSIGVLLVNLGTPDAPTPAAVRRYLREFLSDPRVIEFPRLPWWVILNTVILTIRPRRSARNYAKIWTDAGSPLLVGSRALASRLAERLAGANGNEITVALAMTYGRPSLSEALEHLRSAGIERLLVLPMYPQYSNTTTGAIFERVTRELSSWRRVPDVNFVASYHHEPRYADAVAASIERRWNAAGTAGGRSFLVFSFHSIPQRYADAGDPYERHCRETAAQVAARLGLADGDWTVAFQSRFGREEWLRPYFDELLLGYARTGPGRVTVVCPGFAVDCLETLEEVAIQNRQRFLSAGGEALEYVPALNAGDDHVELYAELVRRHCAGWLPGSRDR